MLLTERHKSLARLYWLALRQGPIRIGCHPRLLCKHSLAAGKGGLGFARPVFSLPRYRKLLGVCWDTMVLHRSRVLP